MEIGTGGREMKTESLTGDLQTSEERINRQKYSIYI